MITRSQVRMARAALGWGVRDLGKRAGIAPEHREQVRKWNGHERCHTQTNSIDTRRGRIIFIPGDSAAGPGIRLREARADD